MSVLMTEKQIVDGVVRSIGETVSSDATTELFLVSHGKATKVEDKQPEIQFEKKGGIK